MLKAGEELNKNSLAGGEGPEGLRELPATADKRISVSGSRGSAQAGVYRDREVSPLPSTSRSWLSGVSGGTCQTSRDVSSIPKSSCKISSPLSEETLSWGGEQGSSEQNQPLGTA